MKHLFIILACGLGLVGCHSPKDQQLHFKVQSLAKGLDTLYLTEPITDTVISRLGTGGEMQSFTHALGIGKLHTEDGQHESLILLEPGKTYQIEVGPDSAITSRNVADSLLNYLWQSNNSFIAQHAGFIFSTQDMDSVSRLFKGFVAKRNQVIEKQKEQLSPQALELLRYQNRARAYSFLFYLGRMVKHIPYQNKYYHFIDSISTQTPGAYTLPQNVLYKYEIQYWRQQDTLESIPRFLDYIGAQTQNARLAAFLKMIFLKSIMESPSYWPREHQLITTPVVKAVLEKERDNPFHWLATSTADNFFSSQKGEMAQDFSAEDSKGNAFHLSDYKGKVIFIDAWATWCGPCLAGRPDVLQLAKHSQSDDRIKVLMVSVDAAPEKWKHYLKAHPTSYGKDLIIEEAMGSDFANHYNVKAIPRYILIDQQGVIVNANLEGASLKVQEMIEQLLGE